MKKAVPAGTLVGLLDRDEIPELVELLLERYYDPLYRHSERRHVERRRSEHGYATTIDASDPAVAAREAVAWIEARLSR
jgi:hypothetical protein